MEPNTLIYAFNEFKVTFTKFYKIILIIDTIIIIINLVMVIEFQGLVARQPYLCNSVCYLDIHKCGVHLLMVHVIEIKKQFKIAVETWR